ncbi:hypothetical protein, partial [Klebsiella quasipneumoniae]|uniref:hypothetical protein n=2 Tax=Klebsiella TaxID=570 RepID=UPI002AB8C5AC
CVEQDDKGWDARKRAYCLKIQPATGSFARNLIYSTKPTPDYAVMLFFAVSPRTALISKFRSSLTADN